MILGDGVAMKQIFQAGVSCPLIDDSPFFLFLHGPVWEWYITISSSSATAEALHASGSTISHCDFSICYNHRNLALALAVLQHFFHLAWINLHVVIDMLRIRLTGASGIGSALFSVKNGLGHAVPRSVKLSECTITYCCQCTLILFKSRPAPYQSLPYGSPINFLWDFWST
jgi:hypothetical protein